MTGKDKMGRYMDRVESFITNDLLNDLSDEIFDGTSFQPEEIKACAEWVLLRASEQARKESADRVRKEFGAQEGGSNTIDRVCAAILGDSVVKENLTTDHIPDSVEKLAIAVKALEVIRDNALNPAHTMTKLGLEQVTDANRAISDRALKEIHG